MLPRSPSDSAFPHPRAGAALSRRAWLEAAGGGLGSLALSAMLAADDAPAGGFHPAVRWPVKAKRVVQLFMAGAASHIDLFDHKPELVKRNGQESDFGEPVEAFQNGLGPWLAPVWDFSPHGECGKLLSEPVAPLGAVVDRMAFIHDMVSTSRRPASFCPAFPAPAAGPPTRSVRSTTTCRRSSSFPTIAATPPTA